MTKCTDFPTTYLLLPGQLIYPINNQSRDFSKLILSVISDIILQIDIFISYI